MLKFQRQQQQNIAFYRTNKVKQLFHPKISTPRFKFDFGKYHFLFKLLASVVYHFQHLFSLSGSNAGQRNLEYLLKIKTWINRRYHSKKSLSVSEDLKTFRKWLIQNNPNAIELFLQSKIKLEDCSIIFGFLLPIPANSNTETIVKTLDSLKKQTYYLFCTSISVDQDTEPGLISMIKESINGDDRFILIKKKPSYETAFYSNQGDYIVCLKVGDFIAPNFLFEMNEHISKTENNEIIYTDIMKNNYSPWFKPKSWSPHLLLSVNILSHAAIKRELITSVGGFDSSFNYSEEWDLDFRCSEKTHLISHICKVLYFENAEDDFQLNLDCFSKTISNHLERRKIHNTEVSLYLGKYIRVKWETKQPLVSIIIPSKNHQPLLKSCIESILNKTIYKNFEIIIIDNNSNEKNAIEYYEKIRNEKNIRIINYLEKFNYSKAINMGAKEASGDYLLFLNNDVEVINPEWLNEMVQWAMLPEIGVVGAKLLYPDNSIQHAGMVIGLKGYIDHVNRGTEEHETNIFGSVDWYRNCSAVTGACQMMRKNVYLELNGYDEKFELVFSDIEICIRSMERYYNLFTPFSILYHKENSTRGQGEPINDILLGRKILKEKFNNTDPFYNPNLSHSAYPSLY